MVERVAEGRWSRWGILTQSEGAGFVRSGCRSLAGCEVARTSRGEGGDGGEGEEDCECR